MKLSSIATGATLATLLSLSANVHALGEADGVWLKTNFTTKNTVEVDKTTGEFKKKTSKGTCYTHLSYSSGTYTGTIYCQSDAGLAYAATPSSFGLTELPGGDAAYYRDDFVEFRNKSGNLVNGWSNSFMTIKKDKNGNFKSAQLKTLGAEMINSALNPADTNLILVGGFTSSSVSIPASKVPFL